ncbi:MAG: GTPase HflX [Candidatus Shikimatogenerans bostrichidophilus]|nr:MAG: GTPase HflX [Candidatus Shikimatogenerans bostrichidophilus]
MYNNNILIGLYKKKKDKIKNIEYLNELEKLLKIFNGKVKKKILQRRFNPNNLTYIGKGLLKKISIYVNKNFIDTIIFDDELSFSQIKNIEKIINCIITDRTKLILDIFFYKAKSYYSKLQIKLAQYRYLLPRLKNMWMHLKKQKGGIGQRGPGEKEIETDKRLIKRSIFFLNKKLKKFKNQLIIQSKNRINIIKISLIGYTNVGKTTIINNLIDKNLLVDNNLFTTLDTNVNKFYIKKKKFIIIDTIGFIKKIPTQLIESFKSTILEIKNSNIILHIIDITSKFLIDKILFIINFLKKLNIINKIIIIVFNKIDKIKKFNINKIKNLFLKNKNIFINIKKKYIYYFYKKKKIKNKFILMSNKNKIYIKNLKKNIYNEYLKNFNKIN